ncbi:MAG: hypothetical protein IPM29_08475 [Planctomycetes bacterium]|nr:hypothetical protein [Planctomycetota bacterium]
MSDQSVRSAVVAGFEGDLLEAVRRHGLRVTLGDEVPFTELLPVDAAAVVALAGPAAASGDPPGIAREIDCGEVRMAVLARAVVDALAAVDDLQLAARRDAWWAARAADAPLPPALADGVRGVVVQCRAARLNNWIVAVVEPVSGATR